MRVFHRTMPRADFNYQVLVAPMEVSAKAMNDTRGFFGLVMNKTMPYGVLRDSEGHIYAPVRALMAPTGTPNPTTFFYQSTRLGEDTLVMDKPRMAAQAQTALPVQTLEGDTVVWRSPDSDEGNA